MGRNAATARDLFQHLIDAWCGEVVAQSPLQRRELLASAIGVATTLLVTQG